MLRSTASVCNGCATGCNVRIDHEGGRIYRLKPRRNPEVNGSWMCDKGRMTYKAVHDEKRLATPLKRSGGELVPPFEVLDAVSRGVAAGPVVIVETEADALEFPEGSVLVTVQPLPRLANLLSREANPEDVYARVAGGT